ncbi:long-chain-fatty-acid--CoA ligase [Siccirubricoccus deserti]|uniref:3-methylmercaptopropionyl-CoA ligase n=1 Tax=Siccirubricoccus deserti TaxID=2013562 RepID=A0A9X0QX18_9PROT|nr:long-chain-fatty-acid--CoA ligase [Siccirubricoccus deserti]MBC4014478.1 long-chain-fatty-acid--CoA ligase [Siccirubricoccus deserti]GGC32584.1 long-chain-fatty-acid--CoA ligase [Siccirubricoccus deserti]
MLGLIQDRPLLISSILEHAARNHAGAKIVSARADGTLVRHSWPQIAARAAQLAHALKGRGVKQGERIATLAWNDHRHLEAYYGISAMGAVLHTVNPRLFPDQIAYILADAEDTHLFVDPTLLAGAEALADKLPPSLTTIVIMGEASQIPADCPLRDRFEVLAQEDLIAGQPASYPWPELDERAASSLCYTSGTTGDPKGVLYSHRSTVIHAISTLQKDCFNIGAADVVMPVVPMFHVNGWGIPYSTAAAGASLVLPGPKLDPASLHRLIEEEGVTFSAGVPTIWTALLNWMRAEPARRFSAPPRLVVGGTALPTAINAGFLKEYGVSILHAWGMTEMSPLGTTNSRKPENADWDADRFLDYARKQGRPMFGVEIRVRDGEGKEIPHDGVAFGELEVRGPWVASAYFNRPGDPAHTPDGWFRTGDVVTVDALGCIEIVDRAKDVIKSGGEWISSITLENLIMGHPAVAEAAVIAIRHPKWDERPLLLVQPKPGTAPTAEEILHFYEGKVAKWWIPDQVEFVESLPHTATGKLWKAELKQRYKDRLAG